MDIQKGLQKGLMDIQQEIADIESQIALLESQKDELVEKERLFEFSLKIPKPMEAMSFTKLIPFSSIEVAFRHNWTEEELEAEAKEYARIGCHREPLMVKRLSDGRKPLYKAIAGTSKQYWSALKAQELQLIISNGMVFAVEIKDPGSIAYLEA